MKEIEEFKISKTTIFLNKIVIYLSFFYDNKIVSYLILLTSIFSLIFSFLIIPQPYTILITPILGFFIGVRFMIMLLPKYIFRIARAKQKLN